MRLFLRILLLSLVVFPSAAFAQLEARKIAEVEEVNCDNIKGYLDYLAGELHNDPTAKTCIIFYGGRIGYGSKRLLPKRGESEARVSFWRAYLIHTRNVEPARIEVVCGGYRERLVVELWVVPSGVGPPNPTPTLTEKDIKFRRGKPKRIDLFGEDDCGIVEGGITTPCKSMAHYVARKNR